VPSAVGAQKVTEGEGNSSERHCSFFRVDMSHRVTGPMSADFDSAIAVRNTRSCASNWELQRFPCKGIEAALCASDLPEGKRLQPADPAGAEARKLAPPQVKFAIANLDLLACAGIRS